MRQNWLSHRIGDIVDHCCFALNTLIDQPRKIMSVALAAIAQSSATQSEDWYWTPVFEIESAVVNPSLSPELSNCVSNTIPLRLL
jgi:hypothetical protein